MSEIISRLNCAMTTAGPIMVAVDGLASALHSESTPFLTEKKTVKGKVEEIDPREDTEEGEEE